MDRPEIVPGTRADLPAVLALLDGAVRWLVRHGRTGQWGSAPQSANPATAARLRGWADEGGLHLARLDGAVVGALAAGAAPPWAPPADEPELYVNLLVTDRDRAGRGLGGALLAHARALARGHGAALLRVDCYAGGDRALVGWYERHGFRPAEAFEVPTADGPWPGQVLAQRLD